MKEEDLNLKGDILSKEDATINQKFLNKKRKPNKIIDDELSSETEINLNQNNNINNIKNEEQSNDYYIKEDDGNIKNNYNFNENICLNKKEEPKENYINNRKNFNARKEDVQMEIFKGDEPRNFESFKNFHFKEIKIKIKESEFDFNNYLEKNNDNNKEEIKTEENILIKSNNDNYNNDNYNNNNGSKIIEEIGINKSSNKETEKEIQEVNEKENIKLEITKDLIEMQNKKIETSENKKDNIELENKNQTQKKEIDKKEEKTELKEENEINDNNVEKKEEKKELTIKNRENQNIDIKIEEAKIQQKEIPKFNMEIENKEISKDLPEENKNENLEVETDKEPKKEKQIDKMEIEKKEEVVELMKEKPKNNAMEIEKLDDKTFLEKKKEIKNETKKEEINIEKNKTYEKDGQFIIERNNSKPRKEKKEKVDKTIKPQKGEKSDKMEIKREDYIFPKLNKINEMKYSEIKKLEQRCKEYKNEPSTDDELDDEDNETRRNKGPLRGKKIAVCGIPKIPREYFYKILRKLGAQIAPWINNKINLMIHGDKLEEGEDYYKGFRYKAAIENRIPIYSESEFEEYIRDFISDKKWTFLEQFKIMEEQKEKSENKIIKVIDEKMRARLRHKRIENKEFKEEKSQDKKEDKIINTKNISSGHNEGEPIIKRKRGRPPKKDKMMLVEKERDKMKDLKKDKKNKNGEKKKRGRKRGRKRKEEIKKESSASSGSESSSSSSRSSSSSYSSSSSNSN